MKLRSFWSALERSSARVTTGWPAVLAALFVAHIVCCTKDAKDGYVYQAPRRLGFSLAEWLKAHPEALERMNACGLPPVRCTDYDYAKCPWYCDENGFQREATLPFWDECPDPSTEQVFPFAKPPEDGPHGSVPGQRFIALLDLDYDYRVADHSLTPVKILRTIEVFDDRPPPFVQPGVTFVGGDCDADGVCFSGGLFITVLWSGVNLVFGNYVSGCCASEPGYLSIGEAYAVEDGKIYGWWGESADWSVIRANIVSWVEQRNKRYPIAMAHEWDSCANLSCNLPRSTSTSHPDDLGGVPAVLVPDTGTATADH